MDWYDRVWTHVHMCLLYRNNRSYCAMIDQSESSIQHCHVMKNNTYMYLTKPEDSHIQTMGWKSHWGCWKCVSHRVFLQGRGVKTAPLQNCRVWTAGWFWEVLENPAGVLWIRVLPALWGYLLSTFSSLVKFTLSQILSRGEFWIIVHLQAVTVSKDVCSRETHSQKKPMMWISLYLTGRIINSYGCLHQIYISFKSNDLSCPKIISTKHSRQVKQTELNDCAVPLVSFWHKKEKVFILAPTNGDGLLGTNQKLILEPSDRSVQFQKCQLR